MTDHEGYDAILLRLSRDEEAHADLERWFEQLEARAALLVKIERDIDPDVIGRIERLEQRAGRIDGVTARLTNLLSEMRTELLNLAQGDS
jgi:hypothetical protein